MVPTYFDKSHSLPILLLQAQQPHCFFNKLNIQQQLIDADFDLVSSNQKTYFVSSEDLILSHQRSWFCLIKRLHSNFVFFNSNNSRSLADAGHLPSLHWVACDWALSHLALHKLVTYYMRVGVVVISDKKLFLWKRYFRSLLSRSWAVHW